MRETPAHEGDPPSYFGDTGGVSVFGWKALAAVHLPWRTPDECQARWTQVAPPYPPTLCLPPTTPHPSLTLPFSPITPRPYLHPPTPWWARSPTRDSPPPPKYCKLFVNFGPPKW